MTALISSPSFPFPHECKPIKTLPAPLKQTYISREIKWLREERHGWTKIALIAYAVLEALVLVSISAGWMVLFAAMKEYRRQEAKEAYFHKAATALPPPNDPIELKSLTRSFNHVQEF